MVLHHGKSLSFICKTRSLELPFSLHVFRVKPEDAIWKESNIFVTFISLKGSVFISLEGSVGGCVHGPLYIGLGLRPVLVDA